MIKRLPIRQFSGGIGTTGEKKDVANSAHFTKNLNPFEDPSYITLARLATKVSGTTVDELILWAEDGSPFDTNRYFLGDGGSIFSEDSGGTWADEHDSGGTGQGLKLFDDYLYYALETELGRYGKLTGTPAFDDAFLSNGTFDADGGSSASGGGTGAADYVPPVAIAETAAARQTFIPTQDPLKAVIINVDVVGSGNWTLTVHDEWNNSIGTSTIANGSMVVGDNTFTLASVGRIVIGNTYHFHVTSTVADGGVDTDAATDLEGAIFSTLFGILVTASYHPMVTVAEKLIIGNGRYLAVWDQSTYNPNQIVLDAGYEVRAIAKFEEFIVAAAIKGGSVSAGEEARLYFWDTIISTGSNYNYYTDVSVGMPNAIHNGRGQLFGVYGNEGSCYIGGGGSDPFNDVVDSIPLLARGKRVEVFPGAITEHEGRTLIGVSGSTDDASLYQGVYEYGRQQSFLPDGFNFPFTISTGTCQGTALKIGMVRSMGTDLYIGWKDGATEGVDKIALGDTANCSGSYETLIFDGGDPDRQILPMNVIVEFEALTAGQSITPKYKLDRAATFTLGTAASTVGDTRVEWPMYTRCKEIEFGFNVASTSNTFPKIIGLILVYDNLKEEKQE